MGRRRAEARARELLESSGQTNPPIDVEALAASVGAQVHEQHFERGLSGVLIRENGRSVIGVSAVDAPVRRRFTIAHEIGHLLLHPGRALIMDPAVRVNRRDEVSSLATDSEEIEANQFAAAVLMPEVLVREAVNQVLTVKQDLRVELLVEDLASRVFNVSAQAMGYRLVNLGLLPSGAWA
jgi:Zn-dependent peptidase ImmA (M78 family)